MSLWNNIKNTDIHIMGFLEGEERESGIANSIKNNDRKLP